MFTKVEAMYELEIPSGVSVQVKDEGIAIKGKLGSTLKRVNQKYVTVKVQGNKITIDLIKQKDLAKRSGFAASALKTELSDSMVSVDKGIEVKMKVLFAHFPTSIEIKGKSMFLKNLFGEKVPREVRIVGDTKVEVKGQDVTVKGVDKYEVGQTIANIRKGCYARGYDTRVFQDGIYINTEE